MFLFKNSETKRTYSLNEIDEIAANFWGKEVHPKMYACPGEDIIINWFDMLGHPIEDLQYFTSVDSDGKTIYSRAITPHEPVFDMQEVASFMLYDNARYALKNGDRTLFIANYLKPYIELCFHLKSLNIVGVGCGW
jgi:hypothetical protein